MKIVHDCSDGLCALCEAYTAFLFFCGDIKFILLVFAEIKNIKVCFVCFSYKGKLFVSFFAEVYRIFVALFVKPFYVKRVF